MHRRQACRSSLRTIELRIEDAYNKKKLIGDPTAYDFAATAVHAIEMLIHSLEPKYEGAHGSALRLIAGILNETPASGLEKRAFGLYTSAFTDGADEELAYAAMMPRRVDHYSLEYSGRTSRRQRR